MVDRNWWARPAKPEEQGSFSDTTSEIVYENVSKPEATEQLETAVRRGDTANEPDHEIADYGDRVRFNVNRTATDTKGSEYNERLKPGN